MASRNSILILFLFINLAAGYQKSQKFRHWFPNWGSHFPKLIANRTCASELTNYSNDYNRTAASHRAICGGVSSCSSVVNCLLGDAFESVKMNMAAAGIILGLTPSFLALMGPSVAEVATLSARSPWLAVLLVVASPAVNPLQLITGLEA